MASTRFFGRVSLLAHPPHVATTCRLRHGAAITAKRTLGSVRYGSTGTAALRAEEVDVAVPASAPVRLAYELQLAGHRYLDVRTEGQFGGDGHPAGAVNIPYMYSTDSGMSKNPLLIKQVSEIFRPRFV